MKKVLMEFLKSGKEEFAGMAQGLMMASPMFILALTGDVDFEFDDFEDIKDHPMAAPFMASFKDLYNGITGETIEETNGSFMNIDTDPNCQIKDDDYKSTKIYKSLFKAMYQLSLLLDDMSADGNISARVLIPDFGLYEINSNAAGINDFLKLGL